MTNRRLLVLLAAVGLSFLSVACARSSASTSPVSHASESGKLRVKFKSAFAAPPVNMNERDANDVRTAMDAEHAVIEHLRRSGYDVVEAGPADVRMTLDIRIRRDDRADATAVFYDSKDRVVDRITLSTEVKRVPYGIADGVRDSKKLSSYADGSKKAKSGGR